jgi:hypothetical protein
MFSTRTPSSGQSVGLTVSLVEVHLHQAALVEQRDAIRGVTG